MLDKKTQYLELVKKRKTCQLCRPELINPQLVNPDYDCEEIGAWSQWYGSLNAKIMLVGQDWGNIDYFNNNLGKDNPNNVTMENLIHLFKTIDIEVTRPYSKKNDLLFFTNTVLCLKNHQLMNEYVRKPHCKKCATQFLKPLIELISPKIIIALGRPAFESICHLYGIKIPPKTKLSVFVDKPQGIPIGNNTILFPVYHCSRLAFKERKFENQISDWQKIKHKMIEFEILHK